MKTNKKTEDTAVSEASEISQQIFFYGLNGREGWEYWRYAFTKINEILVKNLVELEVMKTDND